MRILPFLCISSSSRTAAFSDTAPAGCFAQSFRSDFVLLTLFKLTWLNELSSLNNPDNCDCRVLVISLVIFTPPKIAARSDLFDLSELFEIIPL